MIWAWFIPVVGLAAGIALAMRWPNVWALAIAVVVTATSFWFSVSTDQMQWCVAVYLAGLGLVGGMTGPTFLRNDRVISIGVSVVVGVLLTAFGIYQMFMLGCALSGQCM